jgi:hypothetical protein
MKNKLTLFLLLAISANLLIGCKTTANGDNGKTTKLNITSEDPMGIHNRFERMKYQITGHFSNRNQVMEEDNGEPIQEFIVAPVMQDRPNEYWVYIELFSPYMIDRPLDQRIEQYVRLSRDTFRQEVYYIKNPEKFINAWKEPEFPKINIKEDLIRDEACDLLVVHQDDKPNSFRTIFPEEVTCEMLTSTTAARYVDLVYETDDYGYIMWFTFYDKDKQLLKKTKEQGLSFLRLSQNDVGFINLNKRRSNKAN